MSATMRGRERELATLHGALESARSGRGASLIVLGEPGMGRTTLLDAVAARDFRVLETCGVESEADLPGAGLHRLLTPVVDLVPGLPPAHAEALRPVADGTGPAADRLGLFVAVHRLLGELAGAGPVLCRADDVHRMDRISVAALTFAARRLAGAPILVVLTADAPDDLLAGIPVLRLDALDPVASRQVLADQIPHGLPEDLADDLVELAAGNPLALIELAAALTAEQLSGEAPGPESLPPGSRLRAELRGRFRRLSVEARRLVMLAVVDDRLDTGTVVRAAAEAGVDLAALDEATSAGLVRLDGERVELPTPLVRSTLYAEASLAQRRAAHALLTRVLDPEREPLRWTWQRVAMATEPPHRMADQLDAAAGAARQTGDYLASSRAYHRAAALTTQPEAKALRLIAAATDYSLAGRVRPARALLREARPLASSRDVRGLVDLLHGEIELRDGPPMLAKAALLSAATELAGAHRTLAVSALMLAAEASCLAGNYQHYVEVADRAAGLRRPDEPPATRLMFDHLAGMAATYAGRHAEAVEPLRRVVHSAESAGDPMPAIWASEAAYTLGDAVLAQELATRAVGAARAQRFAVLLPWACVYLSMSALLHDRHITAMSSSLEGIRVGRALGQENSVISHLTILALLAALLGDRETTLFRMQAAAPGARQRGLGRPSALSSWAVACADLANDRPADAMDRLRLLAAGTGYMHPAIRAMAAPHFVEAAVRCGEHAKAAQALETFDSWATATGSTPRLAQSHRCHALLAGDSAAAEEHFREAIRLHRSANAALELAKTELFYAHQLRRSRQPRAARDHLRDALKIFQQYEADLWAERTRTELRAAGESVPRILPRTKTALTPQQEQIAHLVAEGATNREIAAQLVVSPRTVDHHLRNIFAKLGIRSRVELAALFR
ncbi:MAG TPA: LuxR C-terminal-related transcriptional regulator [Actinophytocola sp.]|uniref:LuxR C-terminal-related transcriptional regulator n=1 Tax=Actinophytocola sp. TaxID=1872138 RepID=UPI002DDC9C11|nr:LuxR C-terminal-related transcriptional regulator [Actinophytocola sp.]HEV2781789.1 LuxR C-terminal-related transcriptional regulator [Actinophytocola sp.]